MPETKLAGAGATTAHGRRLLAQRMAFGVIRGLSVLTIAILGLIIGFILYKGLRFSSETRSTVLPWTEASPEGLVVVAHPGSQLKTLEFSVLLGIFTDEYINWAKISGEDGDLLPLAVDPASPEGQAAARLLFASPEAAAWGGLTEFLPSPEAVLDRIASTPGTVALVPESSLAGRKDFVRASLRRLSIAANPEVLGLVDNRQIEDLTDADIQALAAGTLTNWSALGGPDLPVSFLSPPEGDLAVATAATGLATKGKAAADHDSYIAAIASTPGAVGLVFAEDIPAAGLGTLTRKGRVSGWNLTPSYLVEAPRLSGRVGGISTIIGNTFFMLILTLLFAAPLGVAAAVYLVEYARQGPLVRLLRLGTETLAGIPSIIFGLFGMLFFVNILHFGFGLLSGCLTLTLMILPTIVRTSEEALKSVSRALREGSLALGATKLQTIVKVVIPAAAPGILTGLILGIGRAVGETAALIFTMGSDYKLANGLFSSARVLAAHVYIIFAEGISFDRAFSTATVLIVIVLVFNFAAKRLVGRMSRNATA